MKYILSVALATILMTSCTTTHKGIHSSNVSTKNNTVWHEPLKADIVIDDQNKVTGTSSASYFLFFRVDGDKEQLEGVQYATTLSTESFLSLLNPFKIIQKVFTGGAAEHAKNAAAYNAIEGKDADILVHPTYKIKTTNYLIFNRYQVEVSGYLGQYENFRHERRERIEDIIEKRVNQEIVDKLIIEINQ